MSVKSFGKVLSANDTGATGGHQAGILVPKGQVELVESLPYLDPRIKNPDHWIHCVDERQEEWKFRYVYYNNKLHDEKGTRNEYRLTHMTKYFRSVAAKAGDIFIISFDEHESVYRIRLQDQVVEKTRKPIRLKGWARIH